MPSLRAASIRSSKGLCCNLLATFRIPWVAATFSGVCKVLSLVCTLQCCCCPSQPSPPIRFRSCGHQPQKRPSSCQVVVEVDASDIGDGLFCPKDRLWIRSSTPVAPSHGAWHLWTGITTSATGNWQWRWLWRNGSISRRRLAHPLVVWMDHKNYIRTIKRLNSRQVHWALSFTHFNFTFSYHPGLVVPMLNDESLGEGPESILPSHCVVTTMPWEIGLPLKGRPVPVADLHTTCLFLWV